jgi:hypothetical protein
VNIVPYAAPRGIVPTPDGHRCAVAFSPVRRTSAPARARPSNDRARGVTSVTRSPDGRIALTITPLSHLEVASVALVWLGRAGEEAPRGCP